MEQSSLIGRRRSKVSVDFAPPPSDGGRSAPELAHSEILWYPMIPFDVLPQDAFLTPALTPLSCSNRHRQLSPVRVHVGGHAIGVANAPEHSW